MRQKNETATSFKELKEITQVMQALKTSAQTSDNTNTSEFTQQITLKPKGAERAKNHALKPTKKAFSERQRATVKDNSQASADERLKSEQGDNSNAFKFKSDEKNTRGQE
ncbi:hypothetical protein ACLF8C_07735 [Helicobacter pylori]